MLGETYHEIGSEEIRDQPGAPSAGLFGGGDGRRGGGFDGSERRLSYVKFLQIK